MAIAPGKRRPTGDTFYVWDGDDLILNILGRPAASKDAVGQAHGSELKVSVTAAPEHGRATRHMLRFLAPLFGVKPGNIEVIFGWESIHKQLRIKALKSLPAAISARAQPPCDNHGADPLHRSPSSLT